MILEIYTDGSFYKGIGGWASVFVAKHEGQVVSKYICGFENYTTVNRMELRAVIESVKALRRADYSELFDKMTLFSDSQYVVKAINHWHGRNRHKNVDLWTEFNNARIGMKPPLVYKWIRGHNDNHWNDVADSLASEARIHNLTVDRLQSTS